MLKEKYSSNSYSVQIQTLVRLILRMKLYVSKILRLTSLILLDFETEIKEKIFQISSNLKEATVELEDSVNKIIALSHPLAFDLRFLLCSIKLSSELNYITHWSKKTVNMLEKLDNKTHFHNSKEDLTRMIDISCDTLKNVISVLLQFDSKKKADQEILSRISKMLEVDAVVDEIYEKIMQDGLKCIKDENIDPIMVFHTIGVAKNLEKISDCIYNMIITTRYVLTGTRD